MKKLTLTAIISCITLCMFAEGRQVENFNRGWFFKLGKQSANITVAEASDWQRINVPHDFQIEQPCCR